MRDRKKYVTLFGLLVLLPVVWILYRWTIVQITHDEAWSFHMCYKLLWENLDHTANNHVLNSFFMIIETHTLGTALFPIRLHTILSFFGLLYLLFRWGQKLESNISFVLLITLLLFNTYIMDFFGLARGYGMGMFFGLWALYEISYSVGFSPKKRIKIYLLLILASLSVYTELYFLMGFLVFEFFFIALPTFGHRSGLVQYVKWIWIPLLFIFLARLHLNIIRHAGDLEEGLRNGFFQDTIGMFFQRSFDPFITLKVASILGMILMGALIIFLIRYSHSRQLPAWRVSVIMMILLFIHFVFFRIYYIPYPFGRTSLYFITLLFASIVIVVDHLIHRNRSLKRVMLFVVLLILGLHLTYAIQIKNPRTTFEWWGGQGVKEAVIDMAKIENRNMDSLNLLFYSWHVGDYMNYYHVLSDKYRTITNNSYIYESIIDNRIENTEGIIPDSFDYVWTMDKDTFIRYRITPELFDTIGYYPDMETWVLKRKIIF